MNAQWDSKVQLFSSFSLGARWGMSGQHNLPAALPLGKRPVPIVLKAGWAPGPIFAGKENFP